jgi:hypothetical protein
MFIFLPLFDQDLFIEGIAELASQFQDFIVIAFPQHLCRDVAPWLLNCGALPVGMLLRIVL